MSDGLQQIADIIMNGQKTIDTTYGKKTAFGLADLLDRELAEAGWTRLGDDDRQMQEWNDDRNEH